MMKKKLFIMSVLFIGLTVAFFSCNKKESLTKDKPIVQQDDSKIIADILQFKDRMDYLLKHPKEKDLVMMSADSAIDCSQQGNEIDKNKIIWHVHTISYGSLVKTSGTITPTDIQ